MTQETCVVKLQETTLPHDLASKEAGGRGQKEMESEDKRKKLFTWSCESWTEVADTTIDDVEHRWIPLRASTASLWSRNWHREPDRLSSEIRSDFDTNEALVKNQVWASIKKQRKIEIIEQGVGEVGGLRTIKESENKELL